MYSFKKEERLCSKKLIEELFHNGSSFLLYPFHITWKENVNPVVNVPVQAMVSVSKRRFKRAHDRNCLKRRTREAYRLHKGQLLYPFIKENTQLLLAISYIGKDIHDYQFIEKKLIHALEKLVKVYQESEK